jgi:tetratricopeptide (TPR) repeat protein
VVREITTYDPRGKKVDSVAYPIDEPSLPGKEEYKHDAKGNIVEMQLRSRDGKLLSKELYKYEMDEVGNWKKMTTSLAIFQDGKVTDEPVEVTYRGLRYFYNQEIAKIAASAPANKPVSKPALSTETARPEATEPTGTAVRSSEPPPLAKNEPKFTNTPATSTADQESAINKGVNQAVLEAQPVPVSQKLSASNPSVRDTEPPQPSPPVVPLEEKPKTYNDVVAGVPVGNAQPVERKSAPPPVSDSGTLYRLGVAHLEAGKPEDAVVSLRDAVHKDPENALAYLKLGEAYSSLRQYKEAVAVYRMAIEIRPDLVSALAYYQLGLAYIGIDKPSDAVASFKQALYITRAEAENSDGKTITVPSAEQLYYSLGLVYHRVGKYREAIQELKKVIELNPRLAQAHYGLAVCYLALGDRKSAEKTQKVLATLDPALAQKIAEALSNSRITPPGVTDGMLGTKR